MDTIINAFLRQYDELEFNLYEIQGLQNEVSAQLRELELAGNPSLELREEVQEYNHELLLEMYRIKDELKPYEGIMIVMEKIIER